MIEGRLIDTDLAKLPAPEAVEVLDYEQILSSCKDDLQIVLDQDYPTLGINVHEVPESDSINKVLEILAYRELYMRQRINEATGNSFLATATGEGLRSLASWLIDWQEAEPEVIRSQVLNEFDVYHTAGTVAAYTHFALGVAPDQIIDVHVASAQAEVHVTLLPHDADLADQPERIEENQALVSAVQAKLDQDTIRPIGHWVRVKMGTIHRYRITARVGMSDIPGVGEVVSAAQKAVTRYANKQYSPGKHVLKSALLAAIFQPGVKYAILDEPTEDLRVIADATAFCADVDIQVTINDRVPEELINGITLTNTSSVPGRLSGVLTLTPPEHEVWLEYYGVYWADEKGKRLEGYASITVLGAGGDRSFTFDDVVIPEKAIQLVAHTGNENGEMAQGVATPIVS